MPSRQINDLSQKGNSKKLSLCPNLVLFDYFHLYQQLQMGKRQLRVEGESASRRLQLRQPLQRRSFEMPLRRSVRLATGICQQNSEKLVRLTFLNYKKNMMVVLLSQAFLFGPVIGKTQVNLPKPLVFCMSFVFFA